MSRRVPCRWVICLLRSNTVKTEPACQSSPRVFPLESDLSVCAPSPLGPLAVRRRTTARRAERKNPDSQRKNASDHVVRCARRD